MSIWDVFRNAQYNRNLYKTGQANKNEVRSTTVGWREDPINGEDGQTPDPGNSRIRCDGNDVEEYDTPSGNREYYRVLYYKNGKRR